MPHTSSSHLFFFLPIPPPPRSTLFPYTTLFRSLLRRVLVPTMPRPSRVIGGSVGAPPRALSPPVDRKSTRLNSSHVEISYAVFCLKKKKKKKKDKYVQMK